MGLKEKQALAALDFSWSEKRIKEVTGTDIKIKLETDTFSSDMDAILYADSRGAEKVANGIAKVCYNEIGRDAFVEKKIDTIMLINQEAGNRSLAFQENQLLLAFSFTADEFYSEQEVKEAIENLL